MGHIAPFLPSFSKGEVSPLMFGRIDIEQYSTCLEKCRNMWVRPYGCASRLTGTEYISQAKNNGKARLLKFVFSANDSLIIECGAGYFRFYQDGKLVEKSKADKWVTATEYKIGDFVSHDDIIYYCIKEHTSDSFKDDLNKAYWNEQSIYEIVNDYKEEQLDSIQYVQLDDIIKLTCLPVGDDYSTSRPKELLRKANDDWEFREVDFKETPYLDQNITDITLTASAATGESITLKASQEFFNEKHVGANFWLGLKVTDSETNEDVQGYVKVTEFVDAKQVKAKVMSKLSGTSATKIWGEGAFSDYRGFPSCVALYDGRLYYARTPHQPRNIYGSVPFAYEKFTPAVDNEDDGAINIQLATNANGDGSDIRWMIGGAYLLCGTYGGEFIIRGTGDGAITPTDVSAKQRTNWGGESVRPVVAGSFVHFLQRTGKKLRQFQYDYYYDSYKAVDLSIFSEHLLSSPIKQMAYQKAPDSIIYLMREDGDVVMLSLEQDQSVMAWSLLEEMNGKVESIETIPSKDGLFDEVWLLMKRTSLETSLTYHCTNPNLVINVIYSGNEKEEGTISKVLSRTGNETVKGDYKLYIKCGYLYSEDTKIDNECGWTDLAILSRNTNSTNIIGIGIKNGKLYKISTGEDSIVEFKPETTGTGWTIIKAKNTGDLLLGVKNGVLTAIDMTDIMVNGNILLNYQSEELDGKWTTISDVENTRYAYALNNGKLYTINVSFGINTSTFEVTQVGTLTTWTDISGASSISTSDTQQQYAYGIAGGKLYYIIGNKATAIGTSSKWSQVIGPSYKTYGNSEWERQALGICDGKVYTLTTSATILDKTSSLSFKEIKGSLSFNFEISTDGKLYCDFLELNTGFSNWDYIIENGIYSNAITGKTCLAVRNNKLYLIEKIGSRVIVTEIGDAVPYWAENSKIVDPTDYGVLISGKPEYNDLLALIYTTKSGTSRYIERMKNPVSSENPLDWWYVRSGEKINVFDETKENDLTITIADDYSSITATCKSDYFTEEMQGKKLRIIDDNYNTLSEYIITQINGSKEVLLTSNGIIKNDIVNGGKWGVSITAITGLERLNQLEVQIFADGIAQNLKTVKNGTVELDNEGFIVLVGLPYQSYMTTMPIEQGSQNGTAVGKRKRIGELSVRVWNSQGVRYGRDLDNLYETIQDQTEPFTGVIPNIKYNQGWGWISNITLEQSKPYPMNILAIAPILTEVDK